MPIVPANSVAALEFYESHGPLWQSNAAALGIPTTLAASIKADAITTRGLYQAAIDARNASKAATLEWQSALAGLRTDGSAGIAAIKAFADNAADPNAVYALAQIPAPTPPAPLPAPGQPSDFTVGVLASGALSLKWKMTGTQGGNIFYQVKRRLLGETAYTILGGSGNKTFIDETLPAGIDSVQYIVTAFRGQTAGLDSIPVPVQFGVGGEGASFASVSNVKLAA